MAGFDLIRCALLSRAAARDALWIWREAAQWLVDRGLPLWPPSIFDERASLLSRVPSQSGQMLKATARSTNART